MPVSGLEILKRQNALAQHLVVVVVHGETKDSQLGEDNLRRDYRCYVNLVSLQGICQLHIFARAA